MNKLITSMGFAALMCGCAADGESISGEPESKPQSLTASDELRIRNIDLNITTQGPFWPPSEVADEDGNFVVVGVNITEVAPGVIAPVGNSALIVSKDTVPALDENGVETPYNWLAKPYKVVRNLDLSPGSRDMDLVLYSQSFGPYVGDFGPAPRVPAEGNSLYNVNGLPNTCPELIPVGDQARLYKRPQYPLHRVPIFGFQGDGIAHDATTHEEINPIDHPGYEGLAATGPNCPYEGCSGEDPISFRREEPIRLGEWMQAKGALRIELVNFDASQNGYTHAQFDFDFQHLIPDSVYTVWAVRPRNAPTATQAHRLVQPLGIPNVIRTDRNGDVKVSFIVPNPFPDPATDTFGRRIAGLNIVFHSDMQNWGACFSRHPAGVDAHAHFSTFADGTLDFTDLITVPPRH